MKVAVLGNTSSKEELMMQGIKNGTELLWANNISELANFKTAGAYIDLSFDNEEARIQQLKDLQADIIIINSVITTELPENFIRINGWPTFLKRPSIEASCKKEKLKSKTEEIF